MKEVMFFARQIYKRGGVFGVMVFMFLRYVIFRKRSEALDKLLQRIKQDL